MLTFCFAFRDSMQVPIEEVFEERYLLAEGTEVLHWRRVFGERREIEVDLEIETPWIELELRVYFECEHRGSNFENHPE